MRPIKSILVVGSGAMGSQIAFACALAGIEVHVHDINEMSLAGARTDVRERAQRGVERGRLSQAERDAALGVLTFGTDLAVGAAKADLVIEAVVEDLAVKRAVLAELDRLCPSHTILTTNSSSFVPSKLTRASGRPDRFCNVHFFNPVHAMECVEVVRSPETSTATLTAVLELIAAIGKTPVVLDREIDGFIANRILNAVRDEAISLLEGGYASVEAIDTACRKALGYPMGPFELMDLTGIDIGYLSKQAKHAETGDPQDAPSHTVTELVRLGHLGRKSGRGFYEYDDTSAEGR